MGDIGHLPVEVTDSCGDVVTANKNIVDLGFKVANLAVACDRIQSKSEAQEAKNT